MTALGAPGPGMQVDLAARRARLAPLEEHMGPAHDWPQWLVNLALKGRLTNADRLTLPVNLIGNVVPPFVAAKFIAPDLTDETAAREVCHVFRKIHEGYYSAAGADLRAALVASCLRGALPPVDLRAVCLVCAILTSPLRSREAV